MDVEFQILKHLAFLRPSNSCDSGSEAVATKERQRCCVSAALARDERHPEGESSQFIKKIAEYNARLRCINFVVIMESGCQQGKALGQISGVKSERTFSNQKSETRYIREIIYGKKRAITYWEITTDPETMPENSTYERDDKSSG